MMEVDETLSSSNCGADVGFCLLGLARLRVPERSDARDQAGAIVRTGSQEAIDHRPCLRAFADIEKRPCKLARPDRRVCFGRHLAKEPQRLVVLSAAQDREGSQTRNVLAGRIEIARFSIFGDRSLD